ncbi:MAG: hypothetical protein GWO24_26620 [Akkermansiaceae bacterium]|nr:hypothetical protein [Akkermansiaceae bacterium]
MRFALAAGTLSIVALAVLGSQGIAEEPGNPAGRFLFAGDDDWDWASPLGAEQPSKLVRYGAMGWSALDWAETDLKEVRGVLFGSPPNAKKTLSMKELSELRGEHATYRHQRPGADALRALLEADAPPNVIILMQNTGKEAPPKGDEIALLTEWVKSGGRLVVLDDWKKYGGVLDAFLEEALKLPSGPPIEEPPEPEPAPTEEAPSEADPAGPDLEKRFAELLPRLGNERYRIREEASKAMKALGPKITKLIDQTETDDPEIATRLTEIRKKIGPKPAAKAKVNAQRAAQRKAKYEFNVNLVKKAARQLREAKIPHQFSYAFVDMEKRPLPALRISFPVAP